MKVCRINLSMNHSPTHYILLCHKSAECRSDIEWNIISTRCVSQIVQRKACELFVYRYPHEVDNNIQGKSEECEIQYLVTTIFDNPESDCPVEMMSHGVHIVTGFLCLSASHTEDCIVCSSVESSHTDCVCLHSESGEHRLGIKWGVKPEICISQINKRRVRKPFAEWYFLCEVVDISQSKHDERGTRHPNRHDSRSRTVQYDFDDVVQYKNSKCDYIRESCLYRVNAGTYTVLSFRMCLRNCTHCLSEERSLAFFFRLSAVQMKDCGINLFMNHSPTHYILLCHKSGEYRLDIEWGIISKECVSQIVQGKVCELCACRYPHEVENNNQGTSEECEIQHLAITIFDNPEFDCAVEMMSYGMHTETGFLCLSAFHTEICIVCSSVESSHIDCVCIHSESGEHRLDITWNVKPEKCIPQINKRRVCKPFSYWYYLCEVANISQSKYDGRGIQYPNRNDFRSRTVQYDFDDVIQYENPKCDSVTEVFHTVFMPEPAQYCRIDCADGTVHIVYPQRVL